MNKITGFVLYVCALLFAHKMSSVAYDTLDCGSLAQMGSPLCLATLHVKQYVYMVQIMNIMIVIAVVKTITPVNVFSYF